MKKPLAIRIDPEVLEAARVCARQDNRTLTNLIETLLRQRIAASRASQTDADLLAADAVEPTRVG